VLPRSPQKDMLNTLTKTRIDEMQFEINENSDLLSPFEVKVSNHLLTQGSDAGVTGEGKENVEQAQKDIHESAEEQQEALLECQPIQEFEPISEQSSVEEKSPEKS